MIAMNKTRQSGLGLVELMIALVLGMLVVAASLALYANSFGANASALRIARLNNELRNVMTTLTRDLRRAGYHSSMAGGGTNPFAGVVLNATGPQIDFAYDLNSNGIIDTNERFGYRYDAANKSIQVTVNSGTSWENLTDPTRVQITGFSIQDVSPSTVTMGTTTLVNVNVRSFVITLTGTITAGGLTYTRVLQEHVRVRNEVLS